MHLNSNDIIAGSTAVAAVAFAVLCIYLITVLKSARQSLDSAKLAVDEVKVTIDGLQGEIKRLTYTVNEITTDVKGKLQATDPLFDAVRDVGVMLRDVTGSARDATFSFSRAMRRKASELDSGAAKLGWMRWAALGVRVASGIRDGWKNQKGAKMSDNEQLQNDRDAYNAIAYEERNEKDIFNRLNH
jgi:uncharacterized protein YoxC